MKITYYHTLYKREVTNIVTGNIDFKDGKAFYAAHGRKYCVEIKYIVSITDLEEN